MSKSRNWVAKHAHQYNRPEVHRDKKKALKRGYRKHKKSPDQSPTGLFSCLLLNQKRLVIGSG